MAEEKGHNLKQSDAFRENAENRRHLAERASSEPVANAGRNSLRRLSMS